MKIFPKRTRFFILAVLAVLAVYFIFRPGESKKPFGKIDFWDKPEQYSFLLTSDSITTVLTFDGAIWWVNDTYRADEEQINDFFYFLNHIEFLNPIPQNMQKQVVQKLHRNGVHVVVHKKKKLVAETYLINDETAGVLGASKEGTVYIIGTGGFKFEFPYTISADPAFWGVNQIFSTPINELKEITVQHVAEPAQSFHIRVDTGNNPVLNALNDTVALPYEEALMKRYLTYFNNVVADKIVAGGEQERGMLKNDMQHIINIIADADTTTVACIGLRMPDGTFDSDKFLLYRYEQNQWALASWVQFDLILKNLSDFSGKN